MVRLTSPVIPVTDEPQLCFSFWYAAFGAGESALLQIMRQDNSSGETPAEKVRECTSLTEFDFYNLKFSFFFFLSLRYGA